VILIFVNHSFTQDLLKSRHSSPLTYIYKITDEEAQEINSPRKWKVDSSFFHTLVDSYPTDGVYSEELSNGHYLRVFANESNLQIDYTFVQDFDIAVLNNSADLAIKVFTTSGEIIKDARVKVKGKRLRFDKRTGVYRDKKSNRRGFLSVSYKGQVAFYQLSRNQNNPLIKRIYRKTVWGTPIKYAWRPVRFIYRLPIDAVKSIRWGYPQGTINSIVRGSTHLFYNTMCLFDDYYCDWYGSDWKFENKYTGYMAFSKPRYMPGDTVRFKAFIVKKRNGKPLSQPVYPEIYRYSGNSIAFGELEPYAAGGFQYEFVLNDTLDLDLDRRYTIDLNDDRDRTYFSGDFMFEDYELSKNILELEAVSKKQYKGDTAIINVTGKDENDLNILDGRLEVFAKPTLVHDVFETSVFIPDTLYYEELDLDPQQPTAIKIPSSLMPLANISYQVQVSMRTSDNEIKVDAVELSYYEKQFLYDYELIEDSVSFSYVENGKNTRKEVEVKGYDAFGNVVQSEICDLPAKLKINPYFYSYEVYESDSLVLAFDLDEEDSKLSFNAYRTADSLFISSYNPRKVPFIYYLYKTRNEILRGQTTNLNINRKTHSKENFYLSVQYLWGGKVVDHNYEIALDESELNVQLQVPPIVYPGQTVDMTVRVEDYKGKPVSDVDVLVQGLTNKFNAQPEVLPALDRPQKQRELFNTFSVENNPHYQSSKALDYDKWNPLMVLDTIAYFQFLYPEDIYRYEYVPSDSLAQFSPFVVKEGVIQPVSVVYMDSDPVYFSWATNEPYSFSCRSGYHQIRIRTDEYEYYLDSILFSESKKLIFSVDHDHLPKNVNVYKRGKEFTKNEQSNLPKYVMPYRSTFNDRHGYIYQGSRLFSVKPGSYLEVAGPMHSNIVGLQLFGSWGENLWYEPGFEYEFASGLVKMRSKEKEELLPEKTNSQAVDNLKDEFYTEDKLSEEWKNELERRRLASRRYLNPHMTQDNEGKLVLDIKDQAVDDIILNSLLFKLDDPKFMQVYPGAQNVYHGLKQGLYQVIFLHNHESYSIIDSIDVKVNGENYLQVYNAHRANQDSISHRMDRLMDRYFEEHADVSLDQVDKDQLYKTYQQRFQYFGNGEVISGRVIENETGEPIPGVNVVVKGTTHGTITDLEGYYSVKLPPGYTELVFSFIGLTSQEIDTRYQSGNVAMEADVQSLEEVVVIGYGTVAKKSLTASVITISDQLQGRVAGVALGANNRIMIRGTSAVGGEVQPLVVIDGVPYFGNINDLDTEAVTNVEVIKSNEMVGVYGARAANGVILITTKNGVSTDKIARFKGAELSTELMDEMISSSSVRKHFSDEAFWKPTIKTDKNGEAKFQVTFPGDITKWDAFVYAMNGNKQAGQTQKSIKSFLPLSAQLSLPRFLVVNDTAEAIGKLLNYTYDSVTVNTSFEKDGTSVWDKSLSFTNSHIDTLLLTSGEGDSVKMKYMLQRSDGFMDGEERYVRVYPVGLSKSVGEYAALRNDTSVTWNFPDSLGIVKLYANSRSLELLRDKINYLINYQYGCNEQLASKLKALLVSLKLNDQLEVKEARKSQIKRLVKKLTKNQNSDGLWGWWNKSSTSTWVSVHVLEALNMAALEGYKIDIDGEQVADAAVWNLTNTKTYENAVDWLYISHLLDLNIDFATFINQLDSVDHSLPEKLRFEKIKQSMGYPNELSWLVDSLEMNMDGNYFLRDKSGRYRCFYSDRSVEWTTDALALFLQDSTVDEKVRIGLENYLLDKLGSHNYYNTYNTSNAIVVLAETLSEEEKPIENTLTFTGALDTVVNDFPFSATFDPGALSLKKEGLMSTYIGAYQTYWESKPVRDASSFVVTSFFERRGEILEAGEKEKLIAKVEVSKDAEYVLVEIPIPAGCSYADKKSHYFNEVHREYFRNKVSIFCRSLKAGTYEFEVDILPRYKGKYTLNPAKAELMYFPVFVGHEGVKKVEIH